MTKTWIAGLGNAQIVETAWERQMQIDGMENYENSRLGVSPSATNAGKKLLRSLLKKAEGAILTMQSELVGRPRTPRALKATVISIPADTLALITLKEVIDKTYGGADPDNGAAWQSLSRQIASACETELNFRHWVSTSREAARAYAAEQNMSSVPMSYAERMIAEKQGDRTARHRWKQTIKELSEYQWELEEKYFCGDALLSRVCDALPETFERHFLVTSILKKKFIRMVPEARQRFDDIEFSTSNAQCVRKPMLTTPRRWTAND